MLFLGIDQHARQLTVSLRDQKGDVILARQVSTQPSRQPTMRIVGVLHADAVAQVALRRFVSLGTAPRHGSDAGLLSIKSILDCVSHSLNRAHI